MFCFKCGKQIDDGAKFCPYCGAATASGVGGGSSAPEAPVYTIPDFGGAEAAPAPGGKKRRGVLIGAIAAAVVLVIAVAAVFASGLFASPKGQVERAAAKTVAAYADAKSKAGLPDLRELMEGRAYSQRISLELGGISPELTDGEDVSALQGLGWRMDADYDQKGRELDADMAVFWGGEDLVSLQILADDDKLLFASPQFTKGDAYGLNTETLGKDLVRLGAEDEYIDIEELGFNLFDLIELATPSDEETEEMEKLLADARKDLLDAVEVEKEGKEKIKVNGGSVNAQRYCVTIPKRAMENYIDALEEALDTVDSRGRMEEILKAMGFDRDAIDEVMSEMGDTGDAYGQMADLFRQVVEALGDVELYVYVDGGYVCAVECSDVVEGSELELGLYLGGGDNYVDDLSLEISVDGEKVTVKSSGDHAAKSGTFTDETTVRAGSSRLTSELGYEPKAEDGNFQWKLRVDNTAAVVAEGQLTVAKDSVDLRLEELAVEGMGIELVTLKAAYYLGPCEGMRVSMPRPTLLGDMDEKDLIDLMEDIRDNAQDWTEDMMGKLPFASSLS